MNDVVELRPCPFCGRVPTIETYGRSVRNDRFEQSFNIKCPIDQISLSRTSVFTLNGSQIQFETNGYEELVDLWNTRAEENAEQQQ